jgi:hypothetical protein
MSNRKRGRIRPGLSTIFLAPIRAEVAHLKAEQDKA